MRGFTNKVPNKTLSKIAPAINQPPQAQRQGMGSLGQRSPVQSMQNLFGQFQNQQAGRPQIQTPTQGMTGFGQAVQQNPQLQSQLGQLGSLGQRSPVQSMQNAFAQFQNQQAGLPQTQAPVQSMQNAFAQFQNQQAGLPQTQAPVQGMTGFGQAVQQNPQLQSQLGQLGSQLAGGMPLAPTTQQITSEEPRMQLMRSLQRLNLEGMG